MKTYTAGQIPDAVPVLSRGKHRSPRKGACFMEFASYLAGEPWSDHPRCTHPALAALARGVNDSVSDDARAELVPLIPDVVGLTFEDRSMELWLGIHSALAALPVAPEPRQNALALAVLKCEEELAVLEGRERGSMTPAARLTLDDVPGALRWALAFLAATPTRKASQANIGAILENSVLGVSRSVAPDRDALLLEMLRSAIEHCRERFEGEPGAEGHAQFGGTHGHHHDSPRRAGPQPGQASEATQGRLLHGVRVLPRRGTLE